MIHQVHGLRADRLKIELLLHRHRRGFDPGAIVPVARDRGRPADIDLGVEVGRERLALVDALAVEYGERVDAAPMTTAEAIDGVGRVGTWHVSTWMHRWWMHD